MRTDVLMLLLGLACVFAGLWLIVGIQGDVNRQLREFLAVLFFVTFLYLGWDFAGTVQTRRREEREERETEFDRELAGRRNNRRVRR